MWVEIEELLTLVTDEVVTCAWPSAGDAYTLGQSERGFEGWVVDGSDAVDAEADAEDDERGLEGVVC